MNADPHDVSTPAYIAGRIRDDLLDGVIRAGSRLTEKSLADRYERGRHSVRSAFQLLVAQGILEHQRNRGIVVPDVTAERIDSVCSYRMILEMGALEISLGRDVGFASVSSAVAELASLTGAASVRQVLEAHGAVHRRLVETSGNPRLVSAHSECADEVMHLMVMLGVDVSAHRFAAQHRDLVDGLVRGDDDARQALREILEVFERGTMHAGLRRQLSSTGHHLRDDEFE